MIKSVSYITPIMDRTIDDVNFAKLNQSDLVNKNKGAWNYTDCNRVCNNLKYAAEWMYEQGFLLEPFTMQVKLDWKETDIITYEQLNSMIVNNMNALKAYSRPDLEWHSIPSIANMSYNTANWLEQNIHALATQVPIPPDKYTLTVIDGTGSGEYNANDEVDIQADPAEEGYIFDYWSGTHLENVDSPRSSITTYRMPYENATLKANYTSIIPHKLTVNRYKDPFTVNLKAGEVQYLEADPAQTDYRFHHWEIEPKQYEDNIYEKDAATTHFTMPNAEVTLTAVYVIAKGTELIVENGEPYHGYYQYEEVVSVHSSKPSNATFTSWSGDIQYLTGEPTEEYNSVKIPNEAKVRIRASWTTPSVPPATNIEVKMVKGHISSVKDEEGNPVTEGKFTQGDKLTIQADPPEEGYVFDKWTQEGGGSLISNDASTTTFYVGSSNVKLTATYRLLMYHDLVVTTHSGTTTRSVEQEEYFSVNANPAPDGYIFEKWIGDTDSYRYNWLYNINYFDVNKAVTGTKMGTKDRNIEALYRAITTHTLTVKQLSGDVTYTQEELTTVKLTAEDAPEGKRFAGWSLQGEGSIPSGTYGNKTIIYTFGNGDCVLTPQYKTVWTITVVDGTINDRTSYLADEGSSYDLDCRSRAIYEGFDGWTLDGPGEITNLASPNTRFKVGAGNATITANISQYPDKKLTLWWRNPDTGIDQFVSETTYTYGTTVQVIAHTSPDKTKFVAWDGDTDMLYTATASTTNTKPLTKDTVLVATYIYPKSPEYYTLTVIGGTPKERKLCSWIRYNY